MHFFRSTFSIEIAELLITYMFNNTVLNDDKRTPLHETLDPPLHGVSREDCVCKECGSGEAEDASHWLLKCAAWEELRQPLLQLFCQEVHQIGNDEQKAAVILSAACSNYSTLSCIYSMWHARFSINIDSIINFIHQLNFCFFSCLH